MARQKDNARRKRDDDVMGMIIRILVGGSVMGCGLAFAIFLFIGVIVAIRINEARRHGHFPGPPAKKDVNPPDNPPPIDPPPAQKPPINIGPDGFARTTVVGGHFDVPFEDKVPAGGILVGLELAVVANDCIRTIRPIYLVKGQEVKGGQVGTSNPNVVVKANPGYAVSALNVNAGGCVDGLSVSFARLTNGKLDLKDTYESNYVGGKGGNRYLLGGNGMNVVGVAGKRSNDNVATGIGLLLK